MVIAPPLPAPGQGGRPGRLGRWLATSLLLGACGSGSPVAPGDRQGTEAPDPSPMPITGAAEPDPTPRPDSGTDGAGAMSGTSTEEPPGTTSDTATPGPIACGPLSEADRLAILSRLNAARAQARSCGSERFAATGPLVWDTRLEDAAKAHSDDMARNDFFSHTGSDGLNIGDRVGQAGYRLRRAGENIAAGQDSDQAALEGWLTSEGHCRNIMEPAYRDTALACVSDSGATFTRYWTQVFGTAR